MGAIVACRIDKSNLYSNPAATTVVLSPVDTVIGVNVPASKYDNAGYHFVDNGPYGGGGLTATTLQIGAYVAGDRPGTNVLTALDAYNIDLKMDDGKTNTGSVLAGSIYYGEVNGYPPGGGGWGDYCTDGSGNYLVQTPGIICRLAWRVIDLR